jgi:rSAM/selenodomain-associated transferase 1
VKTRLVPPLTTPQALELYRAFLCDQIRFAARFLGRADVELCTNGAWGPDETPEPMPPGIRVTEQGPGDLGRRMARAVRRCHDAGSTATVIIGADSPTLPAPLVDSAFRRLVAGAELALAPAEDGGYVMIGLRQPIDSLFDEIPWGTSEVFESTLRRAALLGLRAEILESWYDVDDGGGLRRLHADLATDAGKLRAPQTARRLSALARAQPGVI